MKFNMLSEHTEFDTNLINRGVASNRPISFRAAE